MDDASFAWLDLFTVNADRTGFDVTIRDLIEDTTFCVWMQLQATSDESTVAQYGANYWALDYSHIDKSTNCVEAKVEWDYSIHMMGQIQANRIGYLFYNPQPDENNWVDVTYNIDTTEQGVKQYKMRYLLDYSVDDMTIIDSDNKFSLCGELEYKFIADD